MAKGKKITPGAGQVSEQARSYKIVGLEMRNYMPVRSKGVILDLAHLTDDQAQALINSGYPHIIPE